MTRERPRDRRLPAILSLFLGLPSILHAARMMLPSIAAMAIAATVTFAETPAMTFDMTVTIPTPASGPVDHSDGIAEMWQYLASINTMASRFHEEKFLALMSKPLPAEGRYYYRRPDYLVRIVDAPYRETIVMKGDSLTIDHRDLNTRETIDLQQQPLARAITQHLLWLFGGNKDLIDMHYITTSQSVEENNYLLELSPRREPLNQIIDKIQIWVNRDRNAFKVQIVEMGGDLTVLTLDRIIINQPLPDNLESPSGS